MAKLKLGPIADHKPVKITLELPAALHRDLVIYADSRTRDWPAPCRSNASHRAHAGTVHRDGSRLCKSETPVRFRRITRLEARRTSGAKRQENISSDSSHEDTCGYSRGGYRLAADGRRRAVDCHPTPNIVLDLRPRIRLSRDESLLFQSIPVEVLASGKIMATGQGDIDAFRPKRRRQARGECLGADDEGNVERPAADACKMMSARPVMHLDHDSGVAHLVVGDEPAQKPAGEGRRHTDATRYPLRPGLREPQPGPPARAGLDPLTHARQTLVPPPLGARRPRCAQTVKRRSHPRLFALRG